MPVIMALDQGTTSSRAILFDAEGQIVGMAQQEFEQYFPRSGWVEHDANEIWSTQLAVAQQVLAEHKLTADDIAAIGITNQRETTLIWDRATGEPIHRAIVWQDRRTASFCDQLKAAGHSELVTQRSGLIIDAYFSATKIRWLLDEVPGAQQRAEAGELAFGTIDSWLIWNLTGGELHLTDVSNASRTMLLNLESGSWDDQLLDLLNIPRPLLPEIRPTSQVYGETTKSIFGKPIKISGSAGDQQAALFGQCCFAPGMAKNTYGTGCFMLMNIGGNPIRSERGLLTSTACQIGETKQYALEGSIFVAGAAVQWLRDALGVIKSSAEIEKLAGSVPDSDGVYLVPAFTGLGAPHWDPYARGTIVGLSRGTNAAHLARATLEGIAFQVADCLDAMQLDSGMKVEELRVDGGACANDLLMQFQADILQAPVVRPRVFETTALGAAFLAGLAVGYWSDLDAIGKTWESDRRFEPKMSAAEVAERQARWQDALQRSRGWAQE